MTIASAAGSGSPPRAWALVVIATWSACLLLAGLTVVGAFGFYAGSFHWFTVPFLVAAGFCAAGATAALASPRLRARLFRIVAPCHALMILPCAFAMALWPGGDDGPRMAWTILVGGGSIVALAIAVLLAVATRHG